MTQELTVWRPSPSQMIVFSCRFFPFFSFFFFFFFFFFRLLYSQILVFSYCRELPYGDCFNTEFMLQITEKPGYFFISVSFFSFFLSQLSISRSPDECLVKVAAYVNWIKVQL